MCGPGAPRPGGGFRNWQPMIGAELDPKEDTCGVCRPGAVWTPMCRRLWDVCPRASRGACGDYGTHGAVRPPSFVFTRWAKVASASEAVAQAKRSSAAVGLRGRKGLDELRCRNGEKEPCACWRAAGRRGHGELRPPERQRRLCVCRPAPAEVAVASWGSRNGKDDRASVGLRLPWRAEAAEMATTTARCRPAPAEVAVASWGIRNGKDDCGPSACACRGERRQPKVQDDCASVGLCSLRWPWRTETAETAKTAVRLSACARRGGCGD